MLKFFSGLLGAGGISGLLSFAPWIIAAILGIGGVGGWFWQQHQVDDQKAQTAAITLERNAALQKVGVLQGALDADAATIKAQTDNIAANDDLINSLQHQTDEDAKASAEAGTQLRNLQNADSDVAAYLATPIPCGLRNYINRRAGPAVAASGADKDCDAVGAKSVAVPQAPAHAQ